MKHSISVFLTALALLFNLSPARGQTAQETLNEHKDSLIAQQFQPQQAGTTGGAAPTDDFPQRLAEIDVMVQERMAALNLPGYTMTVIRYGQVVFQKSYGFADLQQRIPTTPDTVFGLASMTKTFTALTLLSLVDKGLVNLDAQLGTYVPELTPPYAALTIRQLASMTGGVPKEVSREVVWSEQIPILDHTPLVSQPGSQFLYSNFSYRLLGQVIEQVTRRPYLEVVRETVLNPFEMNSTATTVMLESTGRVAQGYGDDMGKGPLRPVEYKNPRISFAAGMLATTTNDLTKYVLGLLNRRIISDAGYQTYWYQRPPLTTGAPSNWAFGWGASNNPNYGQHVCAMNGATAGVASSIILLPESNCAIIALCNLRKSEVPRVAQRAAWLAFHKRPPAGRQQEQPEVQFEEEPGFPPEYSGE